jgi:hypothetical protein
VNSERPHMSHMYGIFVACLDLIADCRLMIADC